MRVLIAAATIVLAGCGAGASVAVSTPTAVPATSLSPTPAPTGATASPIPTESPSPAATASPTASPDPCAAFAGATTGPLGSQHYGGRAKVASEGALRSADVVQMATEIQKAIAVRITTATVFVPPWTRSDLAPNRIVRVFVCANSYDPTPPFPGFAAPAGTYVLSRVE